MRFKWIVLESIWGGYVEVKVAVEVATVELSFLTSSNGAEVAHARTSSVPPVRTSYCLEPHNQLCCGSPHSSGCSVQSLVRRRAFKILFHRADGFLSSLLSSPHEQRKQSTPNIKAFSVEGATCPPRFMGDP